MSENNEQAVPISVEGVQRFQRATGPLHPEVMQILNDQYTYHQWTPEKIEAGNHVRRALVSAAMIIIEHVPPGPDRTVALRKLREARMDANSAITHDGKY